MKRIGGRGGPDTSVRSLPGHRNPTNSRAERPYVAATAALAQFSFGMTFSP